MAKKDRQDTRDMQDTLPLADAVLGAASDAPAATPGEQAATAVADEMALGLRCMFSSLEVGDRFKLSRDSVVHVKAIDNAGYFARPLGSVMSKVKIAQTEMVYPLK